MINTEIMSSNRKKNSRHSLDFETCQLAFFHGLDPWFAYIKARQYNVFYYKNGIVMMLLLAS